MRIQPNKTITRSLLVFSFSILLGSCTLLGGGSGGTTSTPAVTAVPPGSGATETLQAATNTPEVPLGELQFLEKPGPDTLRILNYNVNWDSIFPVDDPQNHEWREVDKNAAFKRILAAVEPDIVCIQEVNPRRDPQQVGDLIAGALQQGENQRWQSMGGRDSVISSRFELLEEGYELSVPRFPPDQEQAGVLVDLPDESFGETDLYIICAHFKSGGGPDNIRIRQRQADALIGHISDSMTDGGNIDLPMETPLIMMGDFNIYETDPAAHLVTLQTGDIDDEDRYGEDIHPDWDQTDLEDALPSHNGLGELFYTWRDDTGRFLPGELDRILFTGSRLVIENAFVLNTTILSDEALSAAGLEFDDVQINRMNGYYDHFPMVVDFRILLNS